jgi:hypothetical protein
MIDAVERNFLDLIRDDPWLAAVPVRVRDS